MSVDLFTGIRLLAAIVTGVLVLAASARLLRIEEFDEAFARVVKRIGRR
jgi:hypothetical protein